MDYESINIAVDEVALHELMSLGARGVPVVSRGQSFVYAKDLNEVARFTGLDYHVEPELTASALVSRLSKVIDTARVLVQQIPAEYLQDNLPGRDRTYQALANHIFEIASGYLKVAGGADFTGSIATAVPLSERTPVELDAHALAIISDLDDWWTICTDSRCIRPVETFYGTQSLHAVLERCTWHVTQHVRQIMMVLEMHQVVPENPLTPADLEGLPLPDNVWDG